MRDHLISELLLNRSWRPQLSITGLAGLPALENAGNVMVPELSLKLSMRLPPTADAEQAASALKHALEDQPPYQAKITFTAEPAISGWHSPPISPWLLEANEQASQQFFSKPAAYWGEGGSIPFMNILGHMYPSAQFMITGVLGPDSNAHGPNESLHIPTAKKITACVASVLSVHYNACR